ncbi:ABC transporter permease/substrate-binding protein [Thiocystis violacea]|uniref:ABC transporter permease/substrate-binding protein n=1 Tax=Thiocystis violacea TaxID=13725 RepID=UPI0019083319|nr:glycine betaine ABC transporter substrate-binding protein [Thiocystis violacea]MBK1721368.1 amino acid ABC transporter permease [Thiocystis violacea]
MRRWPLGVLVLIVFGLMLGGCARSEDEVVIGSKKFTESVILGEMLTALAQTTGRPVLHRASLGGTRILFNALQAGEIDAYVEYTGTLSHEIMARETAVSPAELRAWLADRGIALVGSLGFQNNYALGMPEAEASDLAIHTLSDLKAHPELRFRFGSEFMERSDGWPGLRERYGLPQQDVRGVEHELAYRALGAGEADVTELYTTDAEIAYYGLRTLDDDLGYFPRYDAVLLLRADLGQRAPSVRAALERSLGLIDVGEMVALNAAVKIEGEGEAQAARDFLRVKLGLASEVSSDGLLARLARHSLEHLMLVGVSLTAAICVAVPLGVLAAYRRRLGQVVLSTVGILQTIPALALLVFMIPLFGIGAGPALVALFLYSLLPIVRNTHAGITGIPVALRESAQALGLPAAARLRRIELPLALPMILAGIKTAAVINVGAATLGALVGAGGYGQPILTGIRLDNTALILEGAIPSALFALVTQWLFERAERAVVPRGIRGRSG